MDFGRNLKRKREERNLTQGEVAERISDTQQNVSSYETGYKVPSVRVLIAAADLFGCTTDELIGRSIKR